MRGVAQVHAGHELQVVVHDAVPVPCDAEALHDHVVHEAHADVDVDALWQVLDVDVRRTCELEREQHPDHGHGPRVARRTPAARRTCACGSHPSGTS